MIVLIVTVVKVITYTVTYLHTHMTGVVENYINEELHDLYSLPSTIRMIKSRVMKWAGHVA
jgi:hypothetical protein